MTITEKLDSVGSTERYKVMKLCTGLVKDSNGWDLVVLSQYDRLRKIGLTKLLKSAMQFGKKVG